MPTFGETEPMKSFAGYQGWFSTPNDGVLNRWKHWLSGGRTLAVDLWPDVRDYAPEDLFDTGLMLGNGQPALLFSSYRQGVVNVHMKWCRRFGIDGLCLNRFVQADPSHMAARNLLTQYVLEAARKHDRQFYCKYNLHRHYPGDLIGAIEADFIDTFEQRYPEVMQSTRYYRAPDGRPMIELWGAGFARNNGPFTEADTIRLIEFFQGRGFYVMGGLPYWWREGIRDSKPGWQSTYLRFDGITPWSVSKFKTDASIDHHYREVVPRDLDFLKYSGVDYRRVVYPGASFHNSKGLPPNGTPRRGGDFMARQLAWCKWLNLPLFFANFDECDEGTAIFKTASSAEFAPAGVWTLTLDADGRSMRSGDYLRIAGAPLGELFEGEGAAR